MARFTQREGTRAESFYTIRHTRPPAATWSSWMVPNCGEILIDLCRRGSLVSCHTKGPWTCSALLMFDEREVRAVHTCVGLWDLVSVLICLFPARHCSSSETSKTWFLPTARMLETYKLIV